MALSHRLALGFSLVLGLAAAACDRPQCEATCRRVAACKREATLGERIPGESAPQADPTCMSRCEAATPEFAACEGKKRECAAVVECITYR
jgi:Cys-rich protein (TIGR04453 family)